MVVNYNLSENKKITSRVHSFDALKLFTIILVIWGHCIQYFLSSDYVDEPIYRFIYSFHMPLFMMMAGYFSVSSMNLNPKDFFIKKLRLLLPCISWGFLIWLGLDFIYPLYRHLPPSLNQLMYSLLFSFWFLKSAFLCYVMVYCGIKSRMSKLVWIPLIWIVCKWISHYNLEYMYPCFLIGMALNKTKAKWQNKKLLLFSVALTVFSILLCFWDESFWRPLPGIKNIFINNDVNTFLIFIYRYSFRLIIGIVGSLTFIFLFQILFNKKRNSRIGNLCCSWGQYTLEIYIMQTIVVEIVMSKYLVFDNYGFMIFNFVISPFLSLLILATCVIFIKIIYISKSLGFWLFGKN